MPVKEVPVPTGEEVQEAQEPQEVQPEEVFGRRASRISTRIKTSQKKKKEESWTKAVPKSRPSGRSPKAKAKKEKGKLIKSNVCRALSVNESVHCMPYSIHINVLKTRGKRSSRKAQSLL